jgi:putative hydrolase of the HAD superfamily
MSTIQAALFDLDGTLYDRVAALRSFAADQHSRLTARFGRLGREAFVDGFIALDANGQGAKHAVYSAILSEVGMDRSAAGFLTLDYERRFSEHCRPPDDLYATLELLRTAGMRLGVITNGRTAMQMATIGALGVADSFDAILVSQAEGMRKPDRAIFMRALGRLGCSPDVAVFIGDHPEADIAGAARAGLRTIWRRTSAFFRRADEDAEIESLRELPAILAGW